VVCGLVLPGDPAPPVNPLASFYQDGVDAVIMGSAAWPEAIAPLPRWSMIPVSAGVQGSGQDGPSIGGR